MAVANNSTSIQLSWERPSTPNGVIVHYSLSYNISNNGESPPSPVVVPPTITSYDVTGLNEFTVYTFTLTAVTGVGPGPEANVTERTEEDSKIYISLLLLKRRCSAKYVVTTNLPMYNMVTQG